jgi:hypothetical protein
MAAPGPHLSALYALVSTLLLWTMRKVACWKKCGLRGHGQVCRQGAQVRPSMADWIAVRDQSVARSPGG